MQHERTHPLLIDDAKIGLTDVQLDRTVAALYRAGLAVHLLWRLNAIGPFRIETGANLCVR